MVNHPVLYSYRRCPYAMRARIGLLLCSIQVEQREIVFWDKPKPMVKASPKATVPVLVLSDGRVIDESRDILFWAVNVSGDPHNLAPTDLMPEISQWIDLNDGEFKGWLDRYKYADRFPEYSKAYYREQALPFLDRIEAALTEGGFLIGGTLTIADIALFTFIRQFANVDKVWWQEVSYPHLKHWLEKHLEAHYFKATMKNRPVWEDGTTPLWLDEPDLETRDQFVKQARKTLV